jgi:uncharacterized protein YyaL (SSP411 family)
MLRFARTGLLAAGLVTMFSLAGQAGPFAKPKVQWQPDLKAAHAAAVAQNKPILIVFGAEWCTYCHKLEREVINQPEMAKYINDNFVPVHLDLDHDKQAAEILKVESLPCTVVVSPKAELLGRVTGYQDADKFGKKLAQAEAKYREVQTAAAAGTTRQQ